MFNIPILLFYYYIDIKNIYIHFHIQIIIELGKQKHDYHLSNMYIGIYLK